MKTTTNNVSKLFKYVALFEVLMVVKSTAWAQTVTYTLSHRTTENGSNIYTLNGTDGSSQDIWDGGQASPTSITAEMGSDVTFNVTSSTGTQLIRCGYTDKESTINTIGFSDYFKDGSTLTYVFTFTSKSRNITHIQIDGFGNQSYKTAKVGNPNLTTQKGRAKVCALFYDNLVSRFPCEIKTSLLQLKKNPYLCTNKKHQLCFMI